MRRRFKSLRKINPKKGALIGALLLVLVLSVILSEPFSVILSDSEGSRRSANQIYTLKNIPNIHFVLDSVGKTPLNSHDRFSPVHAAILPHHTDIGPDIDRFWAEIAQHTKPDVVVVVSPAHWDQGQSVLQTTNGEWQTPFGSVNSDDAFIHQLRKKSEIAIEPASFENEHGISVHTPYLAHYFPETPIVPVIAQSKAGSQAAWAFVNSVLSLERNVLFVSSIDFSHYQTNQVMDQYDEETRRIMAAMDLARIDQMGPEYVDSSFALQSYLLWHSLTGCRSQERWHDRNPGTSYFVYTCSERSPLRISAVGDLMLARGVGNALDRMDQAVKQALTRTNDLLKSTTADSDLTFGNLESVLSTKGQALPKAYVFQASPFVVQWLSAWRMSVLSVSNNHSEDYGKSAWEESVDTLRSHGMTAVGGYANEPNVSTVIAGGKEIAFLAFQTLTVPFSEEKAKRAIQDAKQRYDLVVVSLHWGEEYKTTPEASTVLLAHALVDAGADLILGHHPHVLQPVEVYKDKLIFYSLGNFVFDQTGEAQNASIIVNVDVWDDGWLTYVPTPVTIDRFFPRHVFEPAP